jgi:hypothetical protein
MEVNIESLLREKLEEMDLNHMVRNEINSLISESVKEEIKKVVQRECLRMVEAEIVKYMEGEVRTDNGWGKKETYKTFNDLFKKVLAEKLEGQWDAQRIIANAVKERVDAIMVKQYKEVIEKIVNELTGSYLKKT